MSKLEPQVGDKVTLTHENGDTATIVATGTNGYGICGTSNYFSFKEGWSVTEVHEKPKPEPGTFIQALHVYGRVFRGVALDNVQVVGLRLTGGARDLPGIYGWKDLASWEVVQ